MIQVRHSQERGFADHGWLKTYHTFSFADYYSPRHMGYRTLRVINEDRIAGGTGFGSHPHRDMEIISYVVEGGLKHKDSMGTESIILPGEVQRMSAGSGVVHSEYNRFEEQLTHFFQIWIQPKKSGGDPSYAQKSFAKELASQSLTHVISPEGEKDSLSIGQDADMFVGKLSQGESLKYTLRPGRGLWLQMVKGHLKVLGEELRSGDGAAVEKEETLSLKAEEESEFLLFDLA